MQKVEFVQLRQFEGQEKHFPLVLSKLKLLLQRLQNVLLEH